MPARFLTRVLIKNYKSIAACDIELDALTFFVGPNGSGKSNFIDALRFVSDALRTSLDHALRDRGGVNEVRRRSAGHPNHFGMRLEFILPDGRSGYYAFEVGAQSQGGYDVRTEKCEVGGTEPLHFHVSKGEVVESSQKGSAATEDRLYLANVSGLPEFRPVYQALSGMAFYKLNPDRIRDMQPPDAGQLLARDGCNIASVIGRLETRAPERKRRIEEYLEKVVPGLLSVDTINFGVKETLQFQQESGGQDHPWRFLAANMSDGTLRALGVLTSLFQDGVPLIGIEEPEFALHPPAASVLRSALHEASYSRQVVVTSHSPDLLDNENIRLESVCAVTVDQGATQIAPLDSGNREALISRTHTAGELLRLDQLRPDTRLFAERTRQLRLL